MILPAMILTPGRPAMIRTKLLLGLLPLLAAIPLPGAVAQPAPQSARQALLEMFFGKTPGTLEKHLPEVTRAALKQSQTGSGVSMLDTFALVTSQIQARGQELQTFDAGPTLLAIQDPQAHSKFEIVVERDDLQADEDEIELSFHAYKDGVLQTAGVMPRFTFTMKQEAAVWRLNQVTFAVKVSLADPDFLKAITNHARPSITSTGQSQIQPPTGAAWNANHSAEEASAAGALRTLLAAEVTYRATYAEHGYTCSLADMGGMGGSERNEHQAMLIDPRLAGGKKNGYLFAVTNCAGSPAAGFHLTAVPLQPDTGMRAYCGDETGVIRFSNDGNGTTCLSSGQPLP